MTKGVKNMDKILENKGNYLIIKDNDLIKLYSFKSLVSIYDTETKTFKEVPYTYKDVYGNTCSHSMTTTRHVNRFKKFINANF